MVGSGADVRDELWGVYFWCRRLIDNLNATYPAVAYFIAGVGG